MSNRDRSVRSVRVTVASSGGLLTAVVTVPADPVDATALVPALYALADTLVGEAEAAVDRKGSEITCRSGCTACCFQVVPVTEPEARYFAELVDSLPEEQQGSVRSRVAEILSALETEGLNGALEQADRLARSELEPLAIRYHRMRMPCPFLREGACSIYERRPLSCREYLVTSPAEHCERLGEVSVDRVPLRVSLFSHLTRSGRVRWMPLPHALDRSDRAPGSDELLPGPEQLARLLNGDRTVTRSNDPT